MLIKGEVNNIKRYKQVVKIVMVDGYCACQNVMFLLLESYEAPFKTKCHQCFRNLYWTSNIYIGRPIYISDVRYLYPTSDIPALALP